MKLSIIILSWNTKEVLRQCLESVISDLCLVVGINKKLKSSLATNHQSPVTEIIVVDNASTDRSVAMLRKFKVSSLRDSPEGASSKFKVELIENKENLGFSRANNQGIKMAQGKYIMLLNSDTIIREGAIQNLLEAIDRYDTCQMTAVSPLLLLSDGKFQNDYYMRFPNLWQIFLYHNPVLRPFVMKIPFLSSLIAQKPSQNLFAVDQLPGTALMAAKAVWDKVGLLDEDYQFLFEDVDWSWRAKKTGIKLLVIPEAKIVHLGGASWKKKLKINSTDFYYQFFGSMLLFVRKNYSQTSTQIFKWAIILNFFMTLKPLLAWQFLRSNGLQKNYLLQ